MNNYRDDLRYQSMLAYFQNCDFHGHPRFFELIAQIVCTHSDKNQDYTGGKEPLANLRRCEAIGIPASTGVMVRITDKDARFEGWFEKYRANIDAKMLVVDETPLDTLIDRAVYTLLLEIILEEEIARKALESSATAA